MFQESNRGASASTASADNPPAADRTPWSVPLPPPSASYDTVRHMVFGCLSAVQHTIMLLHKLNYAEPHNWSKPIPTGRPNEVMVVLTKKVMKKLPRQ